MFMNAQVWHHGEVFFCVAFQDRDGHAMEGPTIHAGGDLVVAATRSLRLEHTDIRVLHSRNKHLH